MGAGGGADWAPPPHLNTRVAQQMHVSAGDEASRFQRIISWNYPANFKASTALGREEAGGRREEGGGESMFDHA